MKQEMVMKRENPCTVRTEDRWWSKTQSEEKNKEGGVVGGGVIVGCPYYALEILLLI